jgi:hypothetical protein
LKGDFLNILEGLFWLISGGWTEEACLHLIAASLGTFFPRTCEGIACFSQKEMLNLYEGRFEGIRPFIDSFDRLIPEEGEKPPCQTCYHSTGLALANRIGGTELQEASRIAFRTALFSRFHRATLLFLIASKARSAHFSLASL